MEIKLTDREKILIRIGYEHGYEQGHHDTVEACYLGNHVDCAIDFVQEASVDGTIRYGYEAYVVDGAHCNGD